LIHIGDILTLELDSPKGQEKFKCRLVDRKGDHFYIDYPISLKTNRTAFLMDGTKLTATFIGHDGSSVYSFESEINGRIKSNIPMLVISYPGDKNVKKIQRRQFVRIETAIDIAIHPLEYEFSPITAITLDISAGGATVLIPRTTELKSGMSVLTWLVLIMQNGEYHYMKLQSRVVRIIANSETRNKVSLQFIDADSQEKQLLLRLCFERQLENKKKGLSS
jgi:c-di-GMP-binding flagellar brake protein YcgR